MQSATKTAPLRFALTAMLAATVLLVSYGCEKSPESGAAAGPANAPTAPEKADPAAHKGAAAAPEPSAERPSPPSTGSPSAANEAPKSPSGAQAKPTAKPGQPNAPAPPTELSEAKVERYMEVRPQIQTIQQNLKKKMQQAKSRKQAKTLQQDARDGIKEQLGKAGLTPKDYVAIEMKLRQDPELRKRVQSESAND